MKLGGKMKKYSNGDHDTGVVAYCYDKNSIILLFKKGWYYLYDNKKPGIKHVRNMITRAVQGKELTTYINQNVGDNYRERWQE
ncbi:MAG: hypothetical protein ACTHJ8_18495 [Mucilaginibacter sp.]